MSKLNQAILLCKNLENQKDFSKGLCLFDELIMNSLLAVTVRIKALLSLIKIAPDEAHDKIARMRDIIPFLSGDQKENDNLDKGIKILSSLIEQPQINSHERLLCALCLYNNDFIEICYNLFSHLANDISLLIDYRIEASRYLLYSEVTEHVRTARKCLLGIVGSKEYPSSYRYKVIAGLITTTGLSTMLNLGKLNVEYNEKFLFAMQNKFFWNTVNGIRERILSGQHMLGMKDKTISTDGKNKVTHELLNIAKEAEGDDDEDTENIRADAADVVMRLGNAEQKNSARDIIRNLGFIYGGDGKRIKSLSEKHRTAYTDKQNIHDSSINKSINEFITKLISKTNDQLESYQTTHAEVTEILYGTKISSKERIKAFKALNRISIDTATFTDYKITTAEIFIHVWRLMKKHNEDEYNELQKRLIEELIDMADTCSSGHAGRLINILSGYDVELKISWEDQVHSNMSARMQKKIQSIDIEELQEKIVMGMADDAETEDKDAFIKFVTENMPLLKKELYKEFVEDGYIKEKEFEQYFESGTSNWL